jgi:hypothetical protein
MQLQCYIVTLSPVLVAAIDSQGRGILRGVPAPIISPAAPLPFLSARRGLRPRENGHLADALVKGTTYSGVESGAAHFPTTSKHRAWLVSLAAPRLTQHVRRGLRSGPPHLNGTFTAGTLRGTPGRATMVSPMAGFVPRHCSRHC